VEKWHPHFEMRVSQGRNATFPLFFALVLGIAHTQGLATFARAYECQCPISV
jgi:hypothetical protein